MINYSDRAGRLLFATVFFAVCGVARAAPSSSEPLPAATQMLASANQELSNDQLSGLDRARSFVKRGLAHEMLGERADAFADLSAAITATALEPEEQASALYDRGVTLDELGRTDDAIADYSAALQLEPGFAAALNNRANALRRLGRFDEARRDYEASLSAGNPHPEYSEYGMGQIAEALGQPNAALEYYRSALAANPGFTLAEERLVAMDAGNTPAVTGEALVKPSHRDARRRRLAPSGSAGVAPALKPTISDAPQSEGRSVQLGAYRSQSEASNGWIDAQRRTGELLAGLTPSIVAVDLPVRGRYYRLRVDQPDAARAVRLCASLKAKGTGCILPSD